MPSIEISQPSTEAFGRSDMHGMKQESSGKRHEENRRDER